MEHKQTDLRALAEGTTATTDVPLYWVSYGVAEGERILVLHGGPGAQHDYLLPQMLGLADEYRLIFYDQRGGGRSRDDSRTPVTWQTHVQDMAALVAELGLHPLTVVGYSWGALLALLYMLAESSFPRTPISRMILISPAPAARSWRALMEAEFSARQNSEGLLRRRQLLTESGLRESDAAAYRRQLFELSVAGYFHNASRASELTPFRVTGRVQESVWSSLGDYNLLPSLRSLNIPALVVHGRDDPIPVQSSFETAESLGARFLLLENCGHVPYVEQPVALFSAMKSFLHTHKPE